MQRNMNVSRWLATLGLIVSLGARADGPLHVPSPDWRGQVVYFAMTDRFDDGDPANNDQGAGEYDPGDARKYSGGDLAGLRRRLDYIQGLGATALWITPPVASQWWDPKVGYGGYHGYWAEDFVTVDAHLGTLDDYRKLSRALHARGMHLVQDIVVNHTGNFFGWPDRFDAARPWRHVQRNRGSRPHAAPTRPPFDRNDVRKATDRDASIYHWTPAIRDFGDPRQRMDWQLADLDDLDTENPVVQAALRDSYAFWIREAGVDAFRVDTAFYVPADFFEDFMHGTDPRSPGMRAVARGTGRTDFLAFGEGFGIDRAGEEHEARRIETYARGPDGRARLGGMLNFPLYGSTLDVFARGRAPAALGQRIESMMAVHADPWRMPSFVDNHDVDRFLAGGSEAALRQALLMIMTLPGIPVVYYGTEQGFTTQRASMFAGGHGSGGRDHFDADAPLYRHIAAVAALRKAHRAFTHGTPRVVAAEPAGAGVLAYAMRDATTTALVAFNTADRASLLAIDSGFAPGTRLQPLYAIDGAAPVVVIDGNGRLVLPLAARAGMAWIAAEPDGGAAPAVATAPATIGIDALPASPLRADFVVHGYAHGVDDLTVVVDGDLANARRVAVGGDGRWQARIDTAGLVDATREHRVVAWSSKAAAASTPRAFRVEREWTTVVDLADERGDDHGPRGRYRAPTADGWRTQRPLDIEHIRVSTSGGALRIVLGMGNVVDRWSAPNGFDHVTFTAYLELPGQAGGSRVMPLQNAELPDGMRWHRRLRVGGWSSALFTAEAASATAEGTATAPAAEVAVDRDRRTITLTLSPAALGDVADLHGARLYVTTWDYDGAYRALARKPAPFVFGGGDGRRDPLVMDASAVIRLP